MIVFYFSNTNDIIIVCPDGGYNSWYFDSPIDSNFMYETYIIKELIPSIDSIYSTSKSKYLRAITGNSMGGHGSFYLAIRNQNSFAYAGSMSGGLDIRPFSESWNISDRLGPISLYTNNLEDLLSSAKVWISGHTHYNYMKYKNNCLLISNQLGKKRDNITDFSKRKIITI